MVSLCKVKSGTAKCCVCFHYSISSVLLQAFPDNAAQNVQSSPARGVSSLSKALCFFKIYAASECECHTYARFAKQLYAGNRMRFSGKPCTRSGFSVLKTLFHSFQDKEKRPESRFSRIQSVFRLAEKEGFESSLLQSETVVYSLFSAYRVSCVCDCVCSKK